jgi:dTDP-4-dehydrorhamnose reductase
VGGDTVLVTGAGGLLGRALAGVLAGGGWNVHGVTHAELDVADAAAVVRATESVRPRVVVNCAAITNVDACETDPELAWAVNAEGAGHLARAAMQVGADIVHVSTDYVFDGTKGAYTESDECNPLQVYGRAKLAGEDQVRGANVRHCIVRSAWIYGMGGRNFLSRVLDLAARGEAIRAISDQRSSPTFVVDLAGAILALAGSGRHGTYHVTNEGGCSYAEFCRYAVEIAGSPVAVTGVAGAEIDRPAQRPADSSLVGAAWVEAGFEALRPWRDAAAAFCEAWSRARLPRTT